MCSHSVLSVGVLQVSLMPVMAAHQGTYHCYLTAWLQAAQLYQHVLQPLLEADATPPTDNVWEELQAEAMAVFGAHVGVSNTHQTLPPADIPHSQLKSWLWLPGI